MTGDEYEKLARETTGPCTCIPAYKERGLSAPDCVQCNIADDIAAALRSVSSQARENALEESAGVAENGSFLHDGSPEAQFGKQCAAAIRRLKAPI